MPRREQSAGEELANSASHGLALVASVVAAPFIVASARPQGEAGVAGAIVFAATMVLLYLASTLYHALPDGRCKQLALKLDHGAIYLFIAGSYTPFALLRPSGSWNLALLALVWLVAGTGLVLKALNRLRTAWLSTGMYLLLGWLAVVAALPLLSRLTPWSAHWLIAGGIAYTVGVVFFVCDARLRYAHAVWHGFVAAGTGCHAVAVMGAS
ncbi:hemolysin III [Acidovorax soli]|jgi:hemolysin III|uniref:Hemolysin III n=1 Tax=Acidovorax soli TaxID=592050 RepID=A0A7X0UAZ5_9BURK|nr:hemolysin III family protein [Acidovorax soli]MBB6561583.1 hemolysin III [Acidovorax soli]